MAVKYQHGVDKRYIVWSGLNCYSVYTFPYNLLTASPLENWRIPQGCPCTT